VFGWAVHVAFFLSPVLTWTTSSLFCMYLLSVTVCPAIYRYIDKVEFVCAVHVAVVQLSPGLTWTN